MDTVLSNNLKRFNKLNEVTKKGTIESLYKQIELGKICEEGYTHWKQNKKALKMDREALLDIYKYGKTYFGQLRKASKVSIEDVERYIESIGNEPIASIPNLLSFLEPKKEPKPKTWYTFSVSKEIGGGGARFDEKLDTHLSGDKAEVIEHLETLLNELKSPKPATIELLEVIEA